MSLPLIMSISPPTLSRRAFGLTAICAIALLAPVTAWAGCPSGEPGCAGAHSEKEPKAEKTDKPKPAEQPTSGQAGKKN